MFSLFVESVEMKAKRGRLLRIFPRREGLTLRELQTLLRCDSAVDVLEKWRSDGKLEGLSLGA